MDSNTIKMRCSDCGGEMVIDKDKQVLLCPYCGSKSIVMESDAVKIARIQSETELKMKQMEREDEIAKQQKETRDSILTIAVALFLIIFGIIGMFIALS